MNTVFIYALNCPITGRTRYVGKAKNPQIRFKKHLWQAKEGAHHRATWIRSLLSVGKEPVLEILDEVSILDWVQWEVAYIQFFREEGFDLVNATLGGEGGSGRPTSYETRAKIRVANSGKRRSKETCAKIGDVHRGMKHSDEARAKMSVGMLGNQRNAGRKHSEAARANMRAARLAYYAAKRNKKI